jgi:hypothetical protein
VWLQQKPSPVDEGICSSHNHPDPGRSMTPHHPL